MGYKYEVVYWDPDKQYNISVWTGEDFFEAVDEMNTFRNWKTKSRAAGG